MINIIELISKLRDKGIFLSVLESNLKINSSKNVLTPEIISEIKENKKEIIEFLNRINNTNKKTVFDNIKQASSKQYYSLSSAQERMYLLQQMKTDTTAYNMTNYFPVGNISKELIQGAVNILLERHESFRTLFVLVEDIPKQKICSSTTLRIEEHEIANLQELEELHDNFVKPFDLSKAPLLRVAYVKDINTNTNESYLMIDMHHIISDGASVDILQEELSKILNGQELEPLNLQYKDYSEWQNSEEHLIEVKEQEEYWKNEYCDEIPVLSLPYDYPRPVEQSYNGASVELILDKELTDKIQTLCREANTTLYITFLSLFNIWLSKLSGQEDIVVGIPVAGREHPDLSCVIGMFVNTLAFRNYPKRELTYKEFFEEIKNRASEAFDNQLYQFEDLVENLDIVRDIGRNPIFDVSLNLLETEEYLREQVTNQELEHIKGVAKFDLSLDILHNNKDICLTFNYCTKLFKTDTIDRFVIYFKNLIERITLEIKLRDIDIISEEEKHLLLHNFNNTKAEYPKDKTIHQLFEEQVERTPDQTALIFEGQAMSYRDLNRKSNQLARSLRNKGVEPDTIVGIMGDRTFETIVGILGILKSGGAYLPIDPDYPEARINCMLEDAEVKILLTQNKYLQTFSNYNDLNIIDIEYKTIFIGEDTNLDLINRSSDLAYVIYTSGSTGKPKGVMIEHRSLVNLCNWHNSSFDVTENDNATLYAGFRFDASVWELFPYLAKGVSLHIISGDIRLDVGMLNKYYQQNNITISFLPTQVCEQFMSLHNNSLRYLLTGADKLKHFANTNYKVVNNYGPTENTVVTSFFIVDKFYNNIPIGKPIHNTQIYILDRFNNLQPEGVSGELCIGGEGLARGYLNNSTLTSEKFIKNSFGEGRLYKTGDLARWLSDGNIEFLGRIDDQVKIRGFRIELGEIENRLLELAFIKEAVAVVREENDRKYICSYIVTESKEEVLDSSSLRSILSKNLPDYMIPSYFVMLDSIPLTNNGKIDKKVLPSPEIESVEDHIAPRNEIEEKLAEIWSEVLNVNIDEISINANFFEIGGHSLLAVKLLSRINHKYSLNIQLSSIFTNPTITDQNLMIIKTRLQKLNLSDLKDIISENSLNYNYRMNFILTMNIPYSRVDGGANKSNKCLCEELVALGHKVKVVSPALAALSSTSLSELSTELSIQGIQVNDVCKELIYSINGVEVHSVKEESNLINILKTEILELDTDWVIVSSEDPSQMLLKTANEIAPEKTIYIAHTPINLPFGPHSIYPGKNRTELIKKSRSIITIGNFIADYIKEWIDSEVFVNLTPHFGIGPFPKLGSFDNEYILLINPCEIKGIIIFVELAKQFPNLKFAAIPSWGTTEAHLVMLKSISNITIINRTSDIDSFFKKTKLLLMPSLVAEGFPLSPIESMLRGVPVIASEYGGLIESKLGTDFLIPINPIEKYLKDYDENLFPKVIVPEQDITLWKKALTKLTTDKELYNKESEKSRKTALEFVSSLSVVPLVDYFKDLSFNTSSSREAIRIKDRILKEINFDSLDIDKLDSLADSIGSKSFFDESNNYNIIPLPEQELYDISYSQKQMIMSYEISGGHHGHNISNSMVIEGDLDTKILKETLKILIDRHESFRTVFINNSGEFRQKILKEIDFNIEEIDLSLNENQDKEVQKYVREVYTTRFDLYKGSLLRLMLLEIEENKYVFIFSTHHIISDGWSMGVFTNEIFELYNALLKGESNPLKSLDIQYKDYTSWQNRLLNSDENSVHKDYWYKKLSGELPVLNLPIDKTRPTRKSYNGDIVSTNLLKSEIEKLENISKAVGSTTFITLVSIVKVLLYKYTDQRDILVGTPVSGRENFFLKDQIGYYVNMLILRDKINGDESYTSLLSRMKDSTLGAFDHQEYPFDKLVEEFIKDRDLSRSALFDVMVSYSNDTNIGSSYEIGSDGEQSQIDGLKLKQFEIKDDHIGSSHDLAFQFNHTDDGILLSIIFSTDLFNKNRIERMLGHFNEIIKDIVLNKDVIIDDINMLTMIEEENLLLDLNKKVSYYNEQLIHQRFEEIVEKFPKKIACKINNEEIDYNDLNVKANQLAHELRKNEINPNDIIPIICEPLFDMIISILAVLKSGGAYLPIDPSHPKDRIEYMIKDCNCKLLLVSKELNLKLNLNIDRSVLFIAPEENRSNLSSNLSVRNNPEDLAYVIYTSGSTGKPKGVMVKHSNVISLIFPDEPIFDFHENDTWSMFHSYCFDFSVWEMYGALLFGGCLIVVPTEVRKDSVKFLDLLKTEKITVLNQVPASFYNLLEIELESEESNLDIKYVIFGGDKLTPSKLKSWKNKYPQTKLINMFGITETTIHVTYKEISINDIENNISNIGKTIPSLDIYLLDKNQKLVPFGIPGELYICGTGVSKGYLNNEQLTEEKFINNPYRDGEILYRSGDLGKYLPNGDIEYLGRQDTQVQIRGFRIELSEIENTLRSHNLIYDAVVVVKENEKKEQFICAYIVKSLDFKSTDNSLTDINKLTDLKDYLSAHLPFYMIPSFYLDIAKIPLTPNGKIDKKSLPELTELVTNYQHYSTPKTDVEKRLVEIWQEVLNLDKIGITDDFFEIGGHSLNAIRITSMIYKEFNIEVKLGDFFDKPRIEELSEYIEVIQGINIVENDPDEEIEKVRI